MIARERTACGTWDGQRDQSVDDSHRVDAKDCRTVEQHAQQIAVLVDGQPVGLAEFRANLGEEPTVANFALRLCYYH